MSRALKSDKLETKKTETEIVRPDVSLHKNVFLKNQTTSRALKSSTLINGGTPFTDNEKRNKSKLSNAANTASNTPKVAVHKSQHHGKVSETIQRNKVSSSSQQKRMQLRAKQLPATSMVTATRDQNHKSPAINKTSVRKKQNAVLDTPHNVTVCSPPPKKKNASDSNDRETNNSKLIRKESRPLASDQSVVVKAEEHVQTRKEDNNRTENIEKIECTSMVRRKEPVAFEVKFEDKVVKKGTSDFREKLNTIAIDELDGNNEELHYSDDFESYESDFETDSSTDSLTTSDSPSLKSKDVSDISLNQLMTDRCEHTDETDVSQYTITEIERDNEKKFDSGHFDMNSNKVNVTKSLNMPIQFIQQLTDNLETSSLCTSEQMDSGISAYATSILSSDNKNIAEIIYGGYKDFYIKPIISARGSELMTKIQLDVLSFTLVDLKPISYDIFMQNFGKLNTNQSFTQTEGNQMSAEQQTEVSETRTIWTQHPNHIPINTNLDNNGIYNQHFCGEIIHECQPRSPFLRCKFEQSLDDIKQLKSKNCQHNYQNYQKNERMSINYEQLNSFLLRSSLLIDQILGSSNIKTRNNTKRNPAHEEDQVLRRVCEKSYYMETNLLNTLRVLQLFSNNKYNLLITVHESLPDTNVYSSDFKNLLMVWSTNTCDKPLRLLTTWCEVSKVEISNDSSDIIVAALRDGSISLWDLRETHSFCSKLDGYLTHFAATQSIIPSWCGETQNTKWTMDLGTCLDVKSFKSETINMQMNMNFPKTQFVSLHDSGVVTIWTLVEASEVTIDLLQTEKYERPQYSAKFTHTFEHTSPWARVKLMQTSLANIKEYLETKSHHSQSRFDKTKSYFQYNIYSDETLKELHESRPELRQQGIRFSSLECGTENLFICTNRNFILMCTKTLKMDKLKRITINESPFLFPTALKVLSNEYFLAVGLSNGVVVILNCQSHKYVQARSIRKQSILSESVDSIPDSDTIISKSCTIQNMLLNIRKSHKDLDYDREYRPDTAACITLIESRRKPFELRKFDQQVIMSGSVLRRNLIQSLELSSDGWYLFALANGHVLVYDFYIDQEISYTESKETGKIIGIAAGKCGSKENNLMILRPNEEVEVHILNK